MVRWNRKRWQTYGCPWPSFREKHQRNTRKTQEENATWNHYSWNRSVECLILFELNNFDCKTIGCICLHAVARQTKIICFCDRMLTVVCLSTRRVRKNHPFSFFHHHAMIHDGIRISLSIIISLIVDKKESRTNKSKRNTQQKQTQSVYW